MSDAGTPRVGNQPAARVDGQALVRGHFLFPRFLPGLEVIEGTGWLSVAGEADAEHFL